MISKYSISKILSNQDGIKFNVEKVYTYYLCLKNPIVEDAAVKGSPSSRQEEMEALQLMIAYLFHSTNSTLYPTIDKFMDKNSLSKILKRRMTANDLELSEQLVSQIEKEKQEDHYIQEVLPKIVYEDNGFSMQEQDVPRIPSAPELYIALTLQEDSFSKTVNRLNDELTADGRKNDEMLQKSYKNAEKSITF